jgi:hypothetical protein
MPVGAARCDSQAPQVGSPGVGDAPPCERRRSPSAAALDPRRPGSGAVRYLEEAHPTGAPPRLALTPRPESLDPPPTGPRRRSAVGWNGRSRPHEQKIAVIHHPPTYPQRPRGRFVGSSGLILWDLCHRGRETPKLSTLHKSLPVLPSVVYPAFGRIPAGIWWASGLGGDCDHGNRFDGGVAR